MQRKIEMLMALLALVVSPCTGEENNREQTVQTVTIDKVPFATVVFSNKNKFYCSGTLVHLEYVLTSAHCLYDLTGVLTEDDLSVTVMAGSEKLKFEETEVESGKVQLIQSKRIIIHSRYTWSENFLRDLAIIQLKEPFKKTEYVDVAPLQFPKLQKRAKTRKMETRTSAWDSEHFRSLAFLNNEDMISFTCTGYGFGRVLRSSVDEKDGVLKQQLYEVDKHCHCLEKVRSVRSPFNIIKVENLFICDDLGTLAGLCCGDSGGTLVCNKNLRGVATALFHYESESSKRTLCHPRDDGVDNECGSNMTLSVFTDLCYFSEWLHQYIPGFPLTDQECNLVDNP